MLNILFIEDEPESIQTLVRALHRSGNYECCIAGFDDYSSYMDVFVPDVVVLDLIRAGSTPESENVGLGSLKEMISKCQFRPVVIYSAHPDLFMDSHPLIKSVQKGSGSEEKAKAEIASFSEYAKSVKQAEQVLREAFSSAMHEVAPFAYKAYAVENEASRSQRHELIERAAKRRLAAMMDKPAEEGQKLLAWEQYIFPPLSKDYKLGDVLREKVKSSDDATAFRIILTPSCDMVVSGGRTPKVKEILLARCHATKEAFSKKGFNSSNAKTWGKKLQDHSYEELLPYPSLGNLIPQMAANLKDLELVAIGEIGTKYERIASVDSPFRELVSWVYMQAGCRPGIPDRDNEKWASEII